MSNNRLVSKEFITTLSSSWMCPHGVSWAIVDGCGGGGGGGQGGNNSNPHSWGGAGGNGAIQDQFIIATTPGVLYQVQLGVGGKGGYSTTSFSGSAGADGGDTLLISGSTNVLVFSGAAGGGGGRIKIGTRHMGVINSGTGHPGGGAPWLCELQNTGSAYDGWQIQEPFPFQGQTLGNFKVDDNILHIPVPRGGGGGGSGRHGTTAPLGGAGHITTPTSGEHAASGSGCGGAGGGAALTSGYGAAGSNGGSGWMRITWVM